MGLAEGELRVDRLYKTYWLPLDGASWQLEETRGRQTKPRLDWLLVDHLAMKRAELVSADTLFEQYRRWINSKDPFGGDVEVELQSIAASAVVHRRIAEQDADDLLGAFGRFARAFDVSTAMPLVLFLATEARFANEALADALRMIASFIVRRDVCGLPTGSYNKFFIDLVAALRETETIDVQSLRTAMSASQAEITRWPTDEEWRQNWLGRDQYKPSRQPRLRYILEAVEHARRAGEGEIVAIKTDLTIEHIMSQRWRAHWPVPGFDHVAPGEVDVDHMMRENTRDEAINKMGNLTLLTQRLNASVSNGPFAEKMPAVRAHAALTINRDLHAYDSWDEETIVRRGGLLFDIVRQIWPSPVEVS